MPDILGATNPVPGYDKAAVNRNLPVSPENTQIQNIPDPTRVGRTDGRTERQDSTLQGDGRVRYDSNFQTFYSGCKRRREWQKAFQGFSGGIGQRSVPESAQAWLRKCLGA